MTMIQEKVFYAIEAADARCPGRYLDVDAVIEECFRQGDVFNRTQVRKALYRLTRASWCESTFRYGLRFYRMKSPGRAPLEERHFFSRWLASTRNNRKFKTMRAYMKGSK